MEEMIALFLGAFTGWLCTKMYYRDKISRVERQVERLSQLVDTIKQATYSGFSGGGYSTGPSVTYRDEPEECGYEDVDPAVLYGDDPFAAPRWDYDEEVAW